MYKGRVIMMADEMRLGLQGKLRRVWASRGVKVKQKLQFVFEWAYLLLAVDPLKGTLLWDWIPDMRQASFLPVLSKWKVDCLVWDGAASHRGKEVGQLEFERIFQPPYSPEVNPAERIFAEVRRHTEGRIYKTLDEKKAAAETYLKSLSAEPERVKQIAGWDWIRSALENLTESPYRSLNQ